MVTFDLFVRPAIEILSGTEPAPIPFLEAILTEPMEEKPGLTHFLPAHLECGSPAASAPVATDQREAGSRLGSTRREEPSLTFPRVTPLRWQGSGDIIAMSRANCLLVIPPDRETINVGERVHVLPRGL
jgi:molybdopterin biosynthesis enzyme